MLNKNFSTQIENKKFANEIPAATVCPTHPEQPTWLPIGSSDTAAHYRCSTCTPPPSRAFVQRWSNAPPNTTTPSDTANAPSLVATQAHQRTQTPSRDIPLAQPITIAYERPVCPHCACSWIMEVDQRAGRELLCWSCRRVVSENALSEAIAKPKAQRRTRRAKAWVKR